MNLSLTSTPSIARTSARTDVVQRAEKAIAEYAHLIRAAYDEAEPALYGALAATYAAACDLQKDPERLKEFLNERRRGPTSANPMQPIVWKLWRNVPTRDTIRRYASCIALAHRGAVKPSDFAAWVKASGIKAAAAKFTKLSKLPDDRSKAKVAQTVKRDALLAKFSPIQLPEEVGAGHQPGLYLASIRVSPEGRAELVTVFDDLPPAQVDSFIARVLR
jgi:hypothetical protein